MTVTLDPKTVLSGTLDIISSKSDIHRCIICAALSEKSTKIKFTGLSKDIIAHCKNDIISLQKHYISRKNKLLCPVLTILLLKVLKVIVQCGQLNVVN